MFFLSPLPHPTIPPHTPQTSTPFLCRTLLNIRWLTSLNPPNQITRTQPRRPRHSPSDPNLPRVAVVLVVLGVGPTLEVLLAEGHYVDLVLFDEFFCYTETRGVGYDLGDYCFYYYFYYFGIEKMC